MGIWIRDMRFSSIRSYLAYRESQAAVRRKNRIEIILLALLLGIALIAEIAFGQSIQAWPYSTGVGIEIVPIAKTDPLRKLGYFKIGYVRHNSVADFAGLRRDDVIEYFDDMVLKEHATLGEVISYVYRGAPGSTVQIGIKRLVGGTSHWTFVVVRREGARKLYQGY